MTQNATEKQTALTLAQNDPAKSCTVVRRNSAPTLTRTYLFFRNNGPVITVRPHFYKGMGAFSIVKEGLDEVENRVIIKKQYAEFQENERAILEKLGQLVASGTYEAKNSKNIKSVLIQKLVSGLLLRDYIAITPLSLEQKNKLSFLIIKSILDLHLFEESTCILHCDIKPDNLILSEQYDMVNPIDFGGSVIVSSVDETVKIANPIGAIKYRAPEADGSEVSVKSDGYSVGILLREDLHLSNDIVIQLTNQDPNKDLDYKRHSLIFNSGLMLICLLSVLISL